METILLISLLVGGTLLLLIALLYILYKCFTKRKAREVDNSLCEVVVDGVDHDKKVLGPQPIFNVTSSYNEILSEDKISVGDSFREEHSDRDTSHEVRTRYGRQDPQPQSIFSVNSNYKQNVVTSIHGRISSQGDNQGKKPVHLSNQAIKRHIYPNCRGDKDAERFSTRRNKSSQTFKNTVLRVEKWDFHFEKGGTYLRSNNKVAFWQCQRQDNLGNFQVGIFKICLNI